jgi:predicted component of type VI protein secretion system
MLPLVVQIERTNEHVADTCAFKRSPVRIGRNPLNDLPLEETFVSQFHAVVRLHEDRTTYLDLGSTNRTLINGKPIDRNVEVVVDENTDVRIGTLRLHLLRVAAPDELFERRRKSAFARTGFRKEAGELTRTLFLNDGVAALLRPSSAAAAPGPLPLPGVSMPPPRVNPVSAPSGGQERSGRPPSPSPAPPRGPASSKAPSPAVPAPAAPAAPTGDTLLDGYRSYRDGFASLFAAVRREIEDTPKEHKEEQVIALQARFPELAFEPSFRDYLRETGINPLQVGHINMEDWLRRLTDGLFPPAAERINVAMAMERVGEILEVFSQAFVELRRTRDQFCRELSLERYADDNTLLRVDDPRAVLALLLNPEQTGEERTTELSRALTDFALHQVAVVSAVIDGARALLDQAAPDALEKRPDPPPDAALPEDGALDRLFPYAARKLWRRYVAHHQEMIEGDRFTRELFGRAFARRYYSVAGGSGPARKP